MLSTRLLEYIVGCIPATTICHTLHLQLMVPVATERLIVSHRTPSGELTDAELEEEEVTPSWAADVLQFPSSLELDIRVHKGAEPLGKNQCSNMCTVFVTVIYISI
jgi:hypothetical protein